MRVPAASLVLAACAAVWVACAALTGPALTAAEQAPDSTAADSGAGDLWRSQRLARGAAWSGDAAQWLPRPAKVAAMALTPGAVVLAGSSGGLAALSPADGRLLGRWDCPPPVWDGLAVVPGHVLLTTQEGHVVCFGPGQ